MKIRVLQRGSSRFHCEYMREPIVERASERAVILLKIDKNVTVRICQLNHIYKLQVNVSVSSTIYLMMIHCLSNCCNNENVCHKNQTMELPEIYSVSQNADAQLRYC